jgi:hypothetical protein
MSIHAALYETAHGDLLRELDDVQQCVVSTNQRGFADASIAIAEPSLDEQLRFTARAAMPHFQAAEGAGVAYEGRVEDPPIGGETLGLRAFGYARAFDDLPYTALWSTTRVDEWEPVRAEDFLAYSLAARSVYDTQERIFLGPKLNAVFNAIGDGAAMAFTGPDAGTRGLLGIQFAFENNLPANLQAFCARFNASWAYVAAPWVLTGTAAVQRGAIHATFAATDRLLFGYQALAAPITHAGQDGANYLKITNVRIVSATTNRVNTTLTVARTNGTPVTCTVGSTARMYVGMQLVIGSGGANSEMVTVLTVPTATTFTCNVVNAGAGTTVQGFVIYADEIAKDLVSTVAATNPLQLSAHTGLISSPGLDLTDEIYEDARMSDILDQITAYGDSSLRLWNWWVAKDKALILEVRAAHAYTWYVDAAPGAIQIERSADDMANSVYVVFPDTRGRSNRVATATDATSVQRYGLTRRIAVPTQTTNTAQIVPIRDTTLAERKNPQPRIRLTVDQLFDAGGNPVPLWAANAGRGDTIVIRNLSPVLPGDAEQIRRFRLGRTTLDLLNGTLTLESEDPVSTLDALLAAGERRARARQNSIDTAVAAPANIFNRFRDNA